MESTLMLLRQTEGVTPQTWIRMERMTDSESRQSTFHVDYVPSVWGTLLMASTLKGICYIAFVDRPNEGMDDLRHRFPHARFVSGSDAFQQQALTLFGGSDTTLEPLCLHLYGTDFQWKVWRALLQIPVGALTTYGDVARYVESPQAWRAVGTAIGSNPVCFLIPCHRVVRSNGALGGYRWGLERKKSLLQWEKEVACGMEIVKNAKADSCRHTDRSMPMPS